MVVAMGSDQTSVKDRARVGRLSRDGKDVDASNHNKVIRRVVRKIIRNENGEWEEE